MSYKPILRRLAHPAVAAQVLLAFGALALLTLFTRLLEVDDFANYAVLTAAWAVANSFVSTGLGARIAKESAHGSRVIRILASDVMLIAVASVLVFTYVLFLRGNGLDAGLAGLALASFAVVEPVLMFHVGGRRFGRYVGLCAVRSALPILVFVGLARVLEPSLTSAILAIAVGNAATAVLGTLGTRIRFQSLLEFQSTRIGAVTLALWVMASADRFILERLVTPRELATYALAYGLLDRAYRALANAYIVSSLSAAFRGARPRLRGLQALLAVALATGVGGLTPMLTAIVSGGRYEAPLAVAMVLSVGLASMALAAPEWVDAMARGVPARTVVAAVLIASASLLATFAATSALGILGAAIATGLTFASWTLFLLASRHGSERVPSSAV